MFNILGHRFQILKRDINNKENSYLKGNIVDDDKIYIYLKNCIIMHTNILKSVMIFQFTQMIGVSFSLSFLAILGVNLIGISGTAFQVLSNSNDLMEKIRFTVNNLCQIMHLYLLCWYSQKLINSSEQVNKSIGKWYEIPVRSQRLIMFMMMRSHRPCAISAGGFAVMSIETFSSGMKTAMSYVTVLRSAQ
uniref:Olfactory receptor 109 n=1 Tax=Aulacocentrum confusum TaxID=2767324 RepID=A0A7G8Z9C8_9HYME|nr:olfactory receptor 109 [Aulacocentrum confusum]